MAIGLVDSKEFDKEMEKIDSSFSYNNPLSNKSKVITPEILPMDKKGRKEGDNEVPDSLRQIIGEESIVNGRSSAVELASHFNLSPSSVSAYSNGSSSTSSYNKPKKSILDHINKSKLRVAKSAMGKLNEAIDALTPDKLVDTSAKDISGIARNMASVVKDMTFKEDSNQGNPDNLPKFILYAPQFVQENHYESVTVEE